MPLSNSPTPIRQTGVRQHPTDPNRVFFDFDPASPGGRGGASVLLDPTQRLASIDAVFKNVNLPPRSTGGLLADGLRQTHLARPVVLEGYNVVERSTLTALAAGGTGQGTRLGNMLEDAAVALGGKVIPWEPIRDGNRWHLRVHIEYP